MGIRARLSGHLKPSHLIPGHALSSWKMKHGLENLICEVLEEVQTPEELDEREIFWIDKLNTFTGRDGLNRTSGGDSSELKHPEVLEKLRKANSGESSWSKMTWDKVASARKTYKEGKSISEVAELFGLSYSPMYRIILNLSWVDDKYEFPGHRDWERPKGQEWYTSIHPDSYFKQIRDDYLSNDLTKKEMSEKYEMTPSFMTDVLNNKYRPDDNYTPPQKPTPDRVKKSYGRKGVPKPEGFGGKISLANQGQKHPQSKLTEEEAFDIVKRYKGGESLQDLSAEFGVKPEQISRIGRGIRWKHLQERYRLETEVS